MLIMFIVSGLLFTICSLMFGLIFTANMKEGIKKIITTIIVSLLMGFSISGLLMTEKIGDEKNWNNGLCKECNTRYEIFDVEHYRNAGNVYYYKCENGHIISLHSQK